MCGIIFFFRSSPRMRRSIVKFKCQTRSDLLRRDIASFNFSLKDSTYVSLHGPIFFPLYEPDVSIKLQTNLSLVLIFQTFLFPFSFSTHNFRAPKFPIWKNNKNRFLSCLNVEIIIFCHCWNVWELRIGVEHLCSRKMCSWRNCNGAENRWMTKKVWGRRKRARSWLAGVYR